ncbi:MAG: BtpA/SgcQ family protein [Candidatus Pacebacteria bacterium]|nr:BtpA/SgcQ family protein [Candidatus Paceibacterota bacterium]
MFNDIFRVVKPIIAMLHVFEGGKTTQLKQVMEDLDKLSPFVDGLIVENYGWGYQQGSNLATKETRKRIAEITEAVVKATSLPVGVNLLPNDYKGALCVAGSCGAKFIQLDHVTGNFIGCDSVNPEEFLKFRKLFPGIAVLGGIHPKYYTLENPLMPISDSAKKAKPLCDAIVVTGKYTGGEASLNDIRRTKDTVLTHPVLVGSGLNVINVEMQLSFADGAIVGTALKRNGVVPGEPIDENMVKQLIARVEKMRKERKN